MYKDFFRFISLFLFLMLVSLSQNSYAQLSGSYTVPGTPFATLKSAIDSLNLVGVGSGGVTFNVTAGYTESTADSLVLITTGTSGNPILFQKSGAGNNPVITRTDAGTKLTSTLGGQGDAVITIQGSDHVTFDGIDVAASQSAIEYGYFLRKVSATDGCKYVTIKNSTVDMTKGTSAFVIGIYSSNLVAGSPLNSSDGVAVANTGGRNEYVTLTGNTIQDVFSGIYVKGYNHSIAPYDFQDFNFVIGTSGQGNTIQNFAGNAGTATSYGIILFNHTNPTVSYNTIDNKGGGGVDASGPIYGIWMTGTSAINNPGGDVVMNNNNITINQAGIGAVNGLIIAQNSLSMTVNNNTFSIGTFLTTTAASSLISITGAATTKTVNGNQNIGLISKTLTGGSLTCLNSGGTTANNGTETFTGNKFSTITLTGTAGFTGITVGSSGTSTRYFYNNKVSGITMGSGTFTGMSLGTILTEEVYNDTVMTATGSGSATGINCSSTQSGLLETVRDNYVTGLTFTGGSGSFIGIQTGGVSSTSTRYVYNNTITNCSAGTGFQSYGINSGNILNQEMYNNVVTGISAGGNLNGITFASQSSGLSTVYNNTVYDLTTNGDGRAAIGISNASAGTTYFYKNSASKIRNTNNGTSNFTTVRGIDVTTGYKNYVYNNIVSDLDAPNLTATGNNVFGINSTNTANTNSIYLYNNTVYVNATGTTYKSYGIYSVSGHNTELRNNLVVNNSAGLAFAYGRSTNALGTYSMLSDNNNFYSSYKTYIGGTTDTLSTISEFKTTFYPREQSSFAESSPLVNVATAPFDVHINTAAASQTESGGAPVTTPIAITNDYDGDVRNATYPDVGADEFSGITSDLTGPAIVYTPLGYTGSLTDRTLVVNISDPSGVSSTIPGMPILYWKKNYNGTWTADTVDTVVGNDYTFTFGSGVTPNDTVFYYVAAQDLATTPNVRIVPTPGSGGYTSNPPAAATPPTNPDWYQISSVSLAGDYTVGVAEFNQITGRTITFKRSEGKLIPMENGKPYTGDLFVKKAEHPEYNYPDNVQGVYTTLTSAVNDLNLRGVTAPVNFLLTDALYDGTTNTFPLVIKVLNENLPTAVNQVTFKPNTGVTSKITNPLATNALFKILSKYINIDGSNSGGTDRSLTIENSSATSPRVIWFGSVGTNPISRCKVENCNIIVPGAAADGYAVSIADSATVPTAGYSNNITVQNNYITGPYGVYVYSPVVNNILVPGNGSGISINGNTIDSSYNGGLYLNGLDNISVTNNTVSNVRGTTGGGGYFIYINYVVNSSISNNIIGPNSWVGGTVTGIRVGNNLVTNSNLLISGNTISGFLQPAAGAAYGILLEQQTGGVVISKNKINNIKQTNTTSRVTSGIYITGGIPNGDITVANNFIWDIASYGDVSTSSNNAYGIGIQSFTTGANGYKLYHNSVALTTDQTFATSNPACLFIGSGISTPGAVDIRDNIFANFMTVGANRYAVINGLSTNVNLGNINYNDYCTTGPNLGRQGSTNYADLTAWRTATGQDVNSISGDPEFVDTTDLHIDPNYNFVDGKGFYLATVPQDLDGDTRNNPPDIGADEYTFTPPVDPTDVTATTVGDAQINVAFTPNANSNNVVIVWNLTGTFTTPGGTPPPVDSSFAGGTILYNGITSPVNHTGLAPSTIYYYKLFSYNGTYYSSGVAVNDTTQSLSDPSAVSANAVNDTQIDVSFTPNANNNNVILVYNMDGVFTAPTGIPPAPGNPFAGGTLLANTITSPYNHTGLTGSTKYYYKLFSYNGSEYSSGVSVNAETNFQLSVAVADGWNMVSVPGVNPNGQTITSWWLNHTGNVYKFVPGTGYDTTTTNIPGSGYWMKNNGAETYNTGDEWPAGGIQSVTHNPINAVQGWNMFGGYEGTADAAALTTTPAGQIIYPIYKFVPGTGYTSATQIEPGFGYWIKVLSPCQINIPDGLAKGNQKVAQDFKDNWGKITLTDAKGSSYTLYAVKGEVDLSHYELPPVPPAGIFDARFSSGRIAEDINTSAQSIEMRGMTYPVKVQVDNIDIKLQDATGQQINKNVKSGEVITISNPNILKLMVSEQLIPDKYALEQNYPNPFNPSTTIEFSLPENVKNLNISIYNVLGQKVAELANGGMAAGTYKYQWDATNFASGMYIYELRADNFVAIKKMLLLK